MKRFRCYGSAGLAVLVSCLSACAGVQVGAPQTLPGNGPGGKTMSTADQQAVGLNPLPLSPPLYPLTVAIGAPATATRAGQDPYRWLENPGTPAVKKWLAAENQLTRQRLDAIPARVWIKQHLTELAGRERYSVPVIQGGRYFFVHGQAQQGGGLYVAQRLDEPGRPLVELQSGHILDFAPSPGGNIVAYAVQEGGTPVWHFRQVQDGKTLPDRLSVATVRGVSWAHDGSGVYYSRYPVNPGGNERPAVYFHRLGQPQASDTLIYSVLDHPTQGALTQVTPDGHYLVITLLDGRVRNGVELLDLRRPRARPVALFGAWDAFYTFIGASSERLYFLTTHDAQQGCVIAVDAGAPHAGWTTIIPESTSLLERAAFVGDRIVAQYIENAHSVLRLYSADGRAIGDVALPGLGHVDAVAGKGQEAFFAYSDYLTPTEVYRLDLTSGHTQLWRRPSVPVSTVYQTEQVFFLTRDGTRLPMYITHRRDRPRDGNQPLLLRVFNASLAPVFRPEVLTWLDMGGAYAEASVRDNSEQNELDDFTAAAQYLISERYTRSRRLGIYGPGRSGLLVSALLIEHPNLMSAALPHGSTLDTDLSRRWPDYGLSELVLQTYSPAQHVTRGVCYPPTLITTAERDEASAPWHSYKLAAALQAVQFCSHPILLHTEPGTGRDERAHLESVADQWAFLARWLGIADLPSG